MPSGKWSIKVQLNETDIVATPWDIDIYAGPGAGTKSTISDFQSVTISGDVKAFKLHASDKYGNAKTTGGDVIEVSVTRVMTCLMSL